jgi:hypothetical protein
MNPSKFNVTKREIIIFLLPSKYFGTSYKFASIFACHGLGKLIRLLMCFHNFIVGKIRFKILFSNSHVLATLHFKFMYATYTNQSNYEFNFHLKPPTSLWIST